MSKRTNAKYKIARRLGVNLWGRAKAPSTDSGPGQHGARRKKPSDFGTQLQAKQKLKGYYANITERQFRKIYTEAARRRGDTGENLIQLLERRLDAVVYRLKFAVTPFQARQLGAVVYRLKFAVTPFQARQLVSHGHVRVNGKRVNISSYVVEDGDTVEIRQDSRELQQVLAAQASGERQVPDYLSLDEKALKGTFVRAPKLGDVPYPVQMEKRTWWSSSTRADRSGPRPEAERSGVSRRRAVFVSGTGWKSCFHSRFLGRFPQVQPEPQEGLVSTPRSPSSACSSPLSDISRTMSQPPTNSPFT